MRKSSQDLSMMRRGVGAWLLAAGALRHDEVGTLVPVDPGQAEALPALAQVLLLGWAHWPETSYWAIRSSDGLPVSALMAEGRLAAAGGVPPEAQEEIEAGRAQVRAAEEAHDKIQHELERAQARITDLEIAVSEAVAEAEAARVEGRVAARRAAAEARRDAIGHADRADRMEADLRLARMEADRLAEELAAATGRLAAELPAMSKVVEAQEALILDLQARAGAKPAKARDAAAEPAVGDAWLCPTGGTYAMIVIGVDPIVVTHLSVDINGRMRTGAVGWESWRRMIGGAGAEDRAVQLPDGPRWAEIWREWAEAKAESKKTDQWGAEALLDRLSPELLGRCGRWDWEAGGWLLGDIGAAAGVAVVQAGIGPWEVSATVNSRKVTQRIMAGLRAGLAAFLDQINQPAAAADAPPPPKKRGRKS